MTMKMERSFKLYIIHVVLMGMCLTISNAKAGGPGGDEKKIVKMILKCFGLNEITTCETLKHSIIGFIVSDCNTGNQVCQRLQRENSCVSTKCSSTTYTNRSTTVATTPTDEGSQSEHKKSKECPTHVCAALSSSAGASVGLAVGLLVLGLLVGAMATAVLCICCPAVHAKASSIRSGKKETGRGNQADEEVINAQEQTSRPMPSVPFPTLPSNIQSTPTAAHDSDSGRPDSQHIYSESMDPPDGSTNTYGYDHANSPQPRPAPASSPTYGYNKLAHDVIPGTSSSAVPDSAYQPLNADSRQSAEYRQLPGVREDSELRSQDYGDPSGSHQYFVMEEQDAVMDSTVTGLSDIGGSVPHDFFVLEKK